MPRPSCQCRCGCRHKPAKGNRYKCTGPCDALVCRECTLCGGCQRTFAQCMCHKFQVGEPVMCHHCHFAEDLTGAMCDWDTFLEACSWRDSSLGIHGNDSWQRDHLAHWVKRAITRMEYRRTEVRPFLEDCMTMGHPVMFIPQPSSLYHQFEVPGREFRREFAAITRFVNWLGTVEVLEDLRHTLHKQVAGPDEATDPANNQRCSTVWERLVGASGLWTTFLYACGREHRQVGADTMWIRTALSQIRSAEGDVTRFLQECARFGTRTDGTFPTNGIRTDTFLQHMERITGRTIVSFRGRAALTRFVDWLQITGVIRTKFWELRLRDNIHSANGRPADIIQREHRHDAGEMDSNTDSDRAADGSMRSEVHAMSEESQGSRTSSARPEDHRGALLEMDGQYCHYCGSRTDFNTRVPECATPEAPDRVHEYQDSSEDSDVGQRELVPGHEEALREVQEVINSGRDLERWLMGHDDPPMSELAPGCDAVLSDGQMLIDGLHRRGEGYNDSHPTQLYEDSMETDEIRCVDIEAPSPGQRTRGCKSVCRIRVDDHLCGAQCANRATRADGWCDWHQYRCGHPWPPAWPSPTTRGQPHVSSGSTSYPPCRNFASCGNWARDRTYCCGTWMCDTCRCGCRLIDA